MFERKIWTNNFGLHLRNFWHNLFNNEMKKTKIATLGVGKIDKKVVAWACNAVQAFVYLHLSTLVFCKENFVETGTLYF